MTLSENTHVTFTNSTGDDVIGVIKTFEDGKYHIQVRSELDSDETLEVDEHKVRELKVSDPTPCPVAGSQKSYVH